LLANRLGTANAAANCLLDMPESIDMRLVLKEQLEEAKRKIALGSQLIERQYQLIAKLEGKGHNMDQAMTLLIQLVEAQQSHEDERDWLRSITAWGQ